MNSTVYNLQEQSESFYPALVTQKRALRLLAIFAHPDDEIACIGSLAKHVRQGGEAKLVWLTRGELASQFGNTAPQEVATIREMHGRWVGNAIGCDYSFLSFPDSGLTGGRDEALSLAKLIADWKPDRVITWNPFDVHPDHRACYWATLSALKLCRIPKLVGTPHRKPVKLYHYVHQDLNRPVVHVDVSETMAITEQVYSFYQQVYAWNWTVENLRESRKLMGKELGFHFAEKFQEVNLVAVEGLPA
ncbi:MAG: PIG-L family deacetylase [Trueperaceae bacterium]|nr:PIG-L family deacetylase [Trueperaceae bacterium]